MSTRSYIGLLQEDGSVEFIYCHECGYPEGVGLTLMEYYTDTAKIQSLIDLGDISILDAEIGEKVPFTSPKIGCVLAYHRDRGDTWETTRPKIAETVLSYAQRTEDAWTQYGYLFVEGWMMAPSGTQEFRPVAAFLAEQEQFKDIATTGPS